MIEKHQPFSDNMSFTDDWDTQLNQMLRIGLFKQPSFRGSG